MEIVICGAGKVGEVLCRDLSRENHNIVLLELNEKRLGNAINSIDISGYQGNGALFDVQMEAGVGDCDVYIAVTPDDETNIIACITAKKLGARYAIARVRSPEYSRQMGFLSESLGITLLINPELEAAREISHMMLFSSALNVDSFAGDRVFIVENILPADSSLIGKRLRDLGRQYGDVLICFVEREGKVLIPNGDYVLQAGDRLNLSGQPEEIRCFCNGGVRRPQRMNSALVVGGGRLTRYLLPRLEKLHIRTKVIEANEAVADKLAAEFPQTEVVCGDGTSQVFLNEERMANHDAVIALTGIDEENVLIAIFAARSGVTKTITKVNRINLLKVLDNVGLQAIVTPHRVVADQIIRFVRSLENSENSQIEAFYRVSEGRAELLQFKLNQVSPVCNIPLQDLDTKQGILITCIMRQNKVLYPRGQDTLQVGDDVIVASTIPHIQDINDILRRS